MLYWWRSSLAMFSNDCSRSSTLKGKKALPPVSPVRYFNTLSPSLSILLMLVEMARHRRVLGARVRQREHHPDRRPELPGDCLTWQVECGHHSGRHQRRGPDRAGFQVGNADLPDDARTA